MAVKNKTTQTNEQKEIDTPYSQQDHPLEYHPSQLQKIDANKTIILNKKQQNNQ